MGQCHPLILQNWTEATDPYKHVYEDISIAAYLLVSHQLYGGCWHIRSVGILNFL